MKLAQNTHHLTRVTFGKHLLTVWQLAFAGLLTLSSPQGLLARGIRADSVPRQHQEDSPQLPLELSKAMELAQIHAPELLEPNAELGSVSAYRDAASRLVHRPPRVVMSIGPRRIAGGGTLGWDATVGLLQEFSLGGYGQRLGAYAEAADQRAASNLAAVQRDARIRAGLFWIDARVAREILAIREEALAGAQVTLRIAESRASVGKTSPAEAALARALLGSVQASVLSAKGDITVADAQLRYVCGLGLHDPVAPIGPLQTQGLPVNEARIRQLALAQAPELIALRAHANLLERAHAVGKAASKPHVELGPSVTREGTGDWLVLANMSLQLPGVDPLAVDNAHRALEANLAKARVAIAEQVALREVEITLHEREHALELRESLSAGTVAPSRSAVREYEVQYEIGRIDLTTLLAARRELLSAQERWAIAAGDVLRAEVKLQRWVDEANLLGMFHE